VKYVWAAELLNPKLSLLSNPPVGELINNNTLKYLENP
jgi:hypothetical protein